MGENKLGKGLGALFGDIALDDELTPISEPVKQQIKTVNQTVETPRTLAENEVQRIAIAMIDNNINQPRKVFDQDDLHELAESIRTYGVIQPILITPVGNRYMIVAGERRWRAARMAGLTEIPAII